MLNLTCLELLNELKVGLIIIIQSVICCKRVSTNSPKIFFVVVAISTSAMGGSGIDPRSGHHLSAEFSKLLCTLGNLLDKCTNVNELKQFLQFYSHPLYPEKRYIEPHVYCHAKTVKEIMLGLFPHYINYVQHYLLKEIVDGYGTDVCRECFHKYEQSFSRFFGKLQNHPAPMTDEEIENRSGQSRLRVTKSGDTNATKLEDIQSVQQAIYQTTGINATGQVFAHQDPGNSVIFTFLIPNCVIQLFIEMSDEDVDILAAAGITQMQVEEAEIMNINLLQPTTKGKKVRTTLSLTAQSSEVLVKSNSLENYLSERQDIPNHERSHLIAMVKAISDNQLNEVCSEDLLQTFSAHIQDWRTIAPFFGVQEYYYENFTTKYPRVADQNYQLLLLWKMREGDNAKYCHLLETVIVHGKAEEVEALIHIPMRGELLNVCMVS